MKAKTFLTILSLLLSYLSFGQSFKPEFLIGKWVSRQGKDFQIWTFKDASHLQIYNNIHAPGEPDTLNDRYRLEKVTSKNFELTMIRESDENKNHEGKSKCTWLNMNQFKIERLIAMPEFTFTFTREK